MFALRKFPLTMQVVRKQMDGTKTDITEVEDEVYRKVEESQE